LKNLNIFRDQSSKYPVISCFVLAALACFVQGTYALDPKVEISQYTQDFWAVENGFTGGTIYAVTQTGDGYLWIGTEKGLVRFDGLEFKFIPVGNSNLYSDEPVVGLLADDRGNLWIQLRNQYIVRYHDGVFENVLIDSSKIKMSVTVMSQSKNGDILFATLENGVFKYNEEGFAAVIPPANMPRSMAISIAGTRKGEIWLGTRDRGLFQYGGTENKNISDEIPDLKINCLFSAGDEELLIGTDKGMIYWNGREFSEPDGFKPLQNSQIIKVIKDRDSNFWIAANPRGIWRIDDEKTVAIQNNNGQLNGTVTAVFEDREGNLWLGTPRGIGRFRNSAFTTHFNPGGLPADNNGPLFIDSENRTWFAPASGGLYFLENNQVKNIPVQGLEKDIVYSIGGRGEELWIGRQNGGLTHLYPAGGTFASKTYNEKDGLAQNNVYAVHLARDGSVWAGTLSAGVSRLKDGKFKTYTTIDGLALNTVTAMAESSDGKMWFATPGGLSAFDGKRWQTFKSETGLPSDIVNALHVDSRGVLWVGTEKGLASINPDGALIPANSTGSLKENIFGIEEDRTGALWIATVNRVIRVDRDKLLSEAPLDPEIREFGIADGLKGVEAIKRNRSVVADSGGRIWFSLNHGISMIDPRRLEKLSIPALVHIRSFATDNVPLDLRDPISFVAANQNIKIGFAALSLSIPERVKYRYKLEGFDHDWSAPTAANERIYSNLSPGRYIFRVVSTNSEGVWNSSEASLEFKVMPRFWQTLWFQSLCVAAFILSVIALFRLRLFQVKRQLSRRFEERLAERLAERQRIAHDLHDTLLQGVYSASLQLDLVVDEVADDSSVKPILQRVLQLMGQVMEEGRNTLKGLNSRKTDKLYVLEDSFSQIRRDLDRLERIDFQITVKGTTQPIHPVVRDEVYRIGREAIINAFRHSKASRIETELDYAPRFFKLSIRDNGTGIAPHLLKDGRDGHFGLTGMRHCAERIDAKLEIVSSSEDGTIVELSVPDRIAYEKQSTDNLPKWLHFLLSRRRSRANGSGNEGKAK
jgi:ligand-binding sensor domain-containing protein/signal transduction histidine kinase